jgi:hypothetical protein
VKRDIPGTLTSFLVEPNDAHKVYDPIKVYLIDHGEGRGGFIAASYDMAWTAYFGGMGERTVLQFVASCSAEYLANKMRGQFNVRSKLHEKYREQVVAAIQAALKTSGSTE